MKPCFACILLLLMAASLTAQVRHHTQQPFVDYREAGKQKQSTYEGRRISSLEFQGNQHFSSETLFDFITTKRGESYYAEKLETDLDRLRVLLLGRQGYLKATFGSPEIEDTDDGLRIV